MAAIDDMEEVRGTLHLLRAWAGSWDALGERLPIKGSSLRALATGRQRERGCSEEVREAIFELRRRWEREHVRAAEWQSLLPRVQVQLKEAREAREWEQVDQLIRRIDAIMDSKTELIAD